MNFSDLFKGLQAASTDRRLYFVTALCGWLGLIALVAVAAVARFHLPPVAISEWDSWGWLSPALNWLGGNGFREEFEREWLYGAFVAFCLRLTGSFSGYIIIQQILGLAAGVLMWMTWRRWISLFPRHALLEIASILPGLFLVALHLFNATTIAFELSIRPEAIMAFVALLQLYCVVSFCRARWQVRNAAACIAFGALAIPLAWAMYVLKPNWALAVPATTLPVFLGVFGGGPRPMRWFPPVLGCLLVVFTLWLPDKLLFIRTAQTRVVLPMTLFTIHADVIREAMSRELQDAQLSPGRRQFLEEFLPELDREMENAVKGKRFYPRIGFDPDYLMYRSSLFPLLTERWKFSKPELAAFCRESFLLGLRRNPLGYAHKVSTQMGYFFLPDDGTFFRKRVEMGPLYNYVLGTLPATPDEKWNPETRNLMQTYTAQVRQMTGTAYELKGVRTFRNLLRMLGSWSPVIEIFFFVSLAACLAWKPLFPLRLPGLAALIIFAAPAGNALTIALVHALDNSRYRGSYGPLLLFALGVMLFFFVVTLSCTLCRVKKPTP